MNMAVHGPETIQVSAGSSAQLIYTIYNNEIRDEVFRTEGYSTAVWYNSDRLHGSFSQFLWDSGCQSLDLLVSQLLDVLIDGSSIADWADFGHLPATVRIPIRTSKQISIPVHVPGSAIPGTEVMFTLAASNHEARDQGGIVLLVTAPAPRPDGTSN